MDRDFVTDVNQSNYLKLIKIIILAVGAGGITWFGKSLHAEYQQTQQLRQANALLEKKEYNLAIKAYDRLLAANSAEAHFIWINRGYAFLGLGQYRDMLESCSTATSIEPKIALAWNCQGEALYYLKQYPEALKAFEQAIGENSQKAHFWLNKARVLADLQEYSEAIAASERAIELSDRSAQYELAIAFNQKGQSLLKMKQYQESLAAFEQSLKYSPDYLSALQGKGIVLYELNDLERAIAIFEQILQRDNLTKEQEATSLLYKGASLCQVRKLDAAEKAFQTVLGLTKNVRFQEIAQKGCGIQ